MPPAASLCQRGDRQRALAPPAKQHGGSIGQRPPMPLERFPITWNCVIEKESLKFKELEHVLIEKVEQLLRDMLYRDLNANGTEKYTANTSAIEMANEMIVSARKDLRNKKANTKMFHT